MNENIRWKPIPGWPQYLCCSNGDIKRISPARGTRINRILNPSIGNHGYNQLSLCFEGKSVKYLHQEIVMLTFIGERPIGMDICHNDGNKLNNKLSNLRYDTRKNNEKDKILHGRTNRGEKCGSHKIPREIVIDIIKRRRNNESLKSISLLHNLSISTVNGITIRKTWAWLTEEEINNSK